MLLLRLLVNRRELLHRRRAQAPRRIVDDPPQRNLIVRIGEQLQVGDGIFDFFALEKRGAADDVVLDVRLAQRFLDG